MFKHTFRFQYLRFKRIQRIKSDYVVVLSGIILDDRLVHVKSCQHSELSRIHTWCIQPCQNQYIEAILIQTHFY